MKTAKKEFSISFFLSQNDSCTYQSTQQKGNGISSQINYCGERITANFKVNVITISRGLRQPFICSFVEEYIYLFKQQVQLSSFDWLGNLAWQIQSFLCAVTWINFIWCINLPSSYRGFNIYLDLHFLWVFLSILKLHVSIKENWKELWNVNLFLTL